MTKIVLNDIASLANTLSAKALLNENFTTLEEAIDNTLSRDGSVPNQMEADIDLNDNDLLNVSTIDAAEYLLNGVPFVQSVAYANKGYELFSGTGSQFDFILSTNPGSLGNLEISIEGVMQRPGLDFNFVGTTLTFAVAPVAGTDNILVRYDEALPNSFSSADSLLYTPPSTLQPGSVGSFLDDLWAIGDDKGAALIRYLQGGVGAVPWTVQDKLRAMHIDVMEFMSDAERAQVLAGTLADFTTSVQKAIDYAELFAGNGGASVHFPSGKIGYTLLTVKQNNVVLESDGGTYLIKMSATGDGLLIGDQVGRTFGVEVRGFQMGSSVAGISGNLVTFKHVGQSGLYDITQTAAFGVPFRGVEIVNTSQFIYSNNQFQDCSDAGVLIQDLVDIYMDNSRSDSHGGSGYLFNKVAGVYGSNVTAYDNGVCGFELLNTYATPVLTFQNQHWFPSNFIGDTSGSHNWNISQLSQSRLTACWGASHRNSTVDLHGFAIANAIDVEFSGCVATNNNASGLFVLSSCSHVRVTGGGYHGNGVQAGSTHKVGIFGDNPGLTVTGATCTDDLRAAIALPRVQTHGIRITGAGSGVNITGCDLRGNLTAGMDVPTTANGLRVANCDDGHANSYASAATVTISAAADTIEITGVAAVLDIQPRWKDRRLKIGFSSTAALQDVGVGGSFRLPTPTVTPGANGSAAVWFNGTSWIMESFSVNDGV